MNPDNFTHKTNEALVAAHEMASEAGHAQLTPLHLAAALAADKGGILRQAITGASGGDGSAGDSFERVLASALKKLPSQSPPPDSVLASTALIKAIRRAQSAQKKRGDSHLAVDQLLLGLLEDSQISDCLKGGAELEKLSWKGNAVAAPSMGRRVVAIAGAPCRHVHPRTQIRQPRSCPVTAGGRLRNSAGCRCVPAPARPPTPLRRQPSGGGTSGGGTPRSRH